MVYCLELIQYLLLLHDCHFGQFQKGERIYLSEVFPGHVDKFDFCIVTVYLEEKWSVCVCTVVKKQDSRSMSLVERNQVISEIVLIWSYLVTKG